MHIETRFDKYRIQVSKKITTLLETDKADRLNAEFELHMAAVLLLSEAVNFKTAEQTRYTLAIFDTLAELSDTVEESHAVYRLRLHMMKMLSPHLSLAAWLEAQGFPEAKAAENFKRLHAHTLEFLSQWLASFDGQKGQGTQHETQ